MSHKRVYARLRRAMATSGSYPQAQTDHITRLDGLCERSATPRDYAPAFAMGRSLQALLSRISLLDHLIGRARSLDVTIGSNLVGCSIEDKSRADLSSSIIPTGRNPSHSPEWIRTLVKYGGGVTPCWNSIQTNWRRSVGVKAF